MIKGNIVENGKDNRNKKDKKDILCNKNQK